MTTPNLIQQDIGIKLSQLLQIKERSPSPTLGDQVLPVIVIDDLLQSAHPPHRFCTFARIALANVGTNHAWVGVNCRGQAPFPNIRNTDKLLVLDAFVTVLGAGPDRCSLEVGRNPAVAGLGGAFAAYSDTSIKPDVGTSLSDFTGGLSGESPDAADPNAQTFPTPLNVSVRVQGPWIIGVGEACFIRTGIVSVATLGVLFRCVEFPGP